MKTTCLTLSLVMLIVACKHQDTADETEKFSLKVIETRGSIVPKDSMAEPKVVVVNEATLKKIPIGKPKVTLTNTNIHPAGLPKKIFTGNPQVHTPGQDTFRLPKVVQAKKPPAVAVKPQQELAKDPSYKDPNPQNFSTYGKRQGLKHGYVICMLEDRLGNVWFGTGGGGASKFDGKTFTHFTDREGLGDNYIWSMLEDKAGNIWFGTWNGGASKYDGKSFTTFTQKEGLSHNYVSAIVEDSTGNIWFGTAENGICKYNGKTFTSFTTKEGLIGNSVIAMAVDKKGNLWLSTSGGGLSKYDGKSFSHYQTHQTLTPKDIWCIHEDKSGNLWFGTGGGGVIQYDGQSFIHFSDKQGLNGNFILSILEDKSGKLWFCTEGAGVSSFDGEIFTYFAEKQGLSATVWSILEDKSGNLWFGTGGNGVSKYHGNRFTHFTKHEGLSSNTILSIFEDSGQGLWLGALGEGVSKYDGKSFTQFTAKEGLSDNTIVSIQQDRAGNLWFGSTIGGITRYDGKSFVHYTEKEGLSHNSVYSILQDRAGNLWFGTYGGGASKYNGSTFTHYTTEQGLSYNDVSSMLQDRFGNLWFGTWGGGITKYDGETFTHFTKREGLAHDFIGGMLEDHSGNLWFGTRGGGINMYDGKNLIHIDEKLGLINNDVYNLLQDQSGNLYFGTKLGFSILSKSRLAILLKKIKAKSIQESDVFFTNYSYEDGYLGVGSNNTNAIYGSREGTIWIGTNDMLTAYHPPISSGELEKIQPNIQLTNLTLYNENIDWLSLEKNKDSTILLNNGVRIHDVYFNGLSKWYGVPQNLSLSHLNNFLTFHFTSVTQQQSNKLKYQYKLDGFEEKWNALSTRAEATYGNLPPGYYTFKVKAMNSEGAWSTAYHYPFRVRPPWWRTRIAYVFYTIAALILLFFLNRYQRQKLIAREQERVREKQLEQAKEIEHAYRQLGETHQNLKATQSKLIQSEKLASLGELTAGIAHEIQNPLNFVNNFSELSIELTDELKEEINKPEMDKEFVDELISDLAQNQERINHHGKRAASIVKGMLEHSRTSTGAPELTDLNALADEYLRLAYHGLRAKDNNFNATMETHFDPDLPLVSVIPQDIGRVLLNLINNAFYAVHQRADAQPTGTREGRPYEPTVTVSTKRLENAIEIQVKDNGNGIPEAIREKIFQPFFTTKPTGQGTGLGLSLAYDIVTKGHGGTLDVISSEGAGSEFVIQLPFKTK